MRAACRAFYLFFRNEFDKFNNTRALIFDSIYHLALKNAIIASLE